MLVGAPMAQVLGRTERFMARGSDLLPRERFTSPEFLALEHTPLRTHTRYGGAGWPVLSRRLGTPPDGDDPNSGVFELWTLEEQPEGSPHPMCEREWYPDGRSRDRGLVVDQDFENLGAVQRGLQVCSGGGLRLDLARSRACGVSTR